jgi:hypothetical protein
MSWDLADVMEIRQNIFRENKTHELMMQSGDVLSSFLSDLPLPRKWASSKLVHTISLREGMCVAGGTIL